MSAAQAVKNDKDRTMVYVSPETWRRLRDRKDRGQTFNQIIVQLLDESDRAHAGGAR